MIKKLKHLMAGDSGFLPDGHFFVVVTPADKVEGASDHVIALHVTGPNHGKEFQLKSDGIDWESGIIPVRGTINRQEG